MSISPSADRPQRSLREQKRELYQRNIVLAAEAVFADEGYDAAKVSRIAAEAGLSLTTLYSVFESKWDIYRAVYRFRLGELMQLVQDMLQAPLSVLDLVLQGQRMHLMFLMEHPNYLKMQLKEGNAWPTLELLRTPEQIDALSVGVRVLTEAVRRCIDGGLLIDDDPALIARTAIASQQVRLAMWIENEMALDPSHVADDANRQFVRSYCRSEVFEEAMKRCASVAMSQAAS
ncbi:MAG: TetR/AcrR family transcriptional regulator [Polyangiales bacterium]